MLGGRPYNHGYRKLNIQSGYSTNIFFGDAVKLSGGYIVKDTGTSTATPVGVFMGASWMDPTFGFTFRQYWPASTSALANAQPSATVSPQAFVCDDPHVVFQIQANGSVAGTGILGQNAPLVQGSGSTFTGDSAVSLNAGSIGTGSSLPLRIIDYVYGPTSTPGDAYTDLLVIWNFGTHEYLNATGNS